MKINQLILTICFFVGALAAYAQPNKGSVLLGGNVGFSSINQGEANVVNIEFTPKAAFFVSDRFAIGGQVAVEILTGDADYSAFGIGPLARYYFNGSGSTRFFGEGAIAWESVDFGFGGSQSAFGFGLGVGLDYFINQHVALEAVLGYNFRNVEDIEDNSNTIGLTIGIAAFIGGGK